MDCEKALELMSAELDGMCTEQERAALQAHLEACADCRETYRQLRALDEALQDAELEQLALDAMLTRANIAKVNSSVTRGSGGGTRSSKGGKGNSGKGGSKGGGNGGSSSSGTGKGTTDVSAAGLMKLQNLVNYYGTKSNPLVNTAIQNMLKNGTINEATYNAFLKTMK